MNLPKVRFTNIPLPVEIDWMHDFLFKDEWGWGKYIIKKHPKIRKVFSFKTKAEQVKFLKKYNAEFRNKNKELIEKNKTEYQKEWQKIEKHFFKLLSEIMDIDWPKSRKTIKAMISINPICPRFLDNWSFSIFCNYKKINDAMETIMHECCHFLYFEKWKSLHPRMNCKRFESPHIEWHLSEITAPVILNDERVQKLLKKRAFFYSEYWKLEIGGKAVPEYFKRLYRQNINKTDGFEKYLREAYKIIKQYKKIFR